MSAARYDVVVLGAGSAGLAAAVTAAREGARVLLVEAGDQPGGMGGPALVHTFCGLYHPDSPTPKLANPGFPAEMESRMRQRTGSTPVQAGRLFFLPQVPAVFGEIACQLIQAEPRLTWQLHTRCTAACPAPGGWLVTLTSPESSEVFSRTVIDTTGDAALAPLIGAAWHMDPAETLQRPACIAALHGVPPLSEAARLLAAGTLAAAVRDGSLPATALGAAFRPSPRPGECFVTLDLAADESPYLPLDATCRDTLLASANTLLDTLLETLRQRLPGWADARFTTRASRLGIRESRRWHGRATLTGDDLLASRRTPQDIALAAWPIELRESARGPKFLYPRSGIPGGIPLDCLRAAEAPGIYCAGRCLSADHTALASVRVIGTCFATGQAAGLAAAREAAGLDPAATPDILRARHGPWMDPPSS